MGNKSSFVWKFEFRGRWLMGLAALAAAWMAAPPIAAGAEHPSGLQTQETMIFTAQRYLGYRPVERLTDESDYGFELWSDGTWKYHSMKTGTTESGAIKENLTKLIESLQKFESKIPAVDPTLPQIADAPKFSIKLQRGDATRQGQLKVNDPLAVVLHRCIQSWREGSDVMPQLPGPVQSIALADSTSLEKRQAFAEPVRIESHKELIDFVDSDQLAYETYLQIDFENRALLVFRWAGSGQDQIEYEIDQQEDSTNVAFSLKPGLTRDLRNHVRMFSVDADAQVDIAR